MIGKKQKTDEKYKLDKKELKKLKEIIERQDMLEGQLFKIRELFDRNYQLKFRFYDEIRKNHTIGPEYGLKINAKSGDFEVYKE